MPDTWGPHCTTPRCSRRCRSSRPRIGCAALCQPCRRRRRHTPAPTAGRLASQGNVKEAQFDVDFFRGFQCVLNGLDNLEARRHVNRLCLAAGVPLVESGTAGFLGQVGAAAAPP